MADTTHVDVNEVNKQASAHETTRDSINTRLNSLRTEIDNTVAASASAATKAMETAFQNWVESMRSSVLSHLKEMAENMRSAAGDQQATDSETMKSILNLPMETGKFLSAGS